MSKVTDLVREQAMKIFSPEDAQLVIADLEAAKLMDIADDEECDRILLAILHYSEGDLGRFDVAFLQAKIDWRDALVCAGLGDANWREVLQSRGIDKSRLPPLSALEKLSESDWEKVLEKLFPPK